MYKIIPLIFLLFSCNYPDIDTVPDFKSLNITMQESIDLCKINKSDNNEDCYKEIKDISDGL